MIALGEKFLPQITFSSRPCRIAVERNADEFAASPAVFRHAAKTSVVIFDEKDVENFIAVFSRIIIAQEFGADNLRHIFDSYLN